MLICLDSCVHPFFQSKQGMIDMLKSTDGFAMFDNFFPIKYYRDYIDCQILDIPRAYFPAQFAYTIQKDSPFLEAFTYHMNVLKERGAMKVVSTKARVINAALFIFMQLLLQR